MTYVITALLIISSVTACVNYNKVEATNTKSEKATIERVIDGDTFAIENNVKVRLIGVDTPETVKPNTPVQYYGKEASNYSKKVLTGKTVYLKGDVQNRDKYNRLLRYVYLEDGTFYNEQLVKEGYARVMTVPPDIKYQDIFLRAERYARQNNKGLWGKN